VIHQSHTGSSLTLLGAALAVAEPVEQAFRTVCGIPFEDIKWATSVFGGFLMAATGLVLHLAERRERERIRIQQLDDAARRTKELLDLENRIKMAQLARQAGLEPDARPDRQAAGISAATSTNHSGA
jgi:hypothetical protein